MTKTLCPPAPLSRVQMATLEGYAYPPGREDDDDSIYVKARDMERFSQTYIGKPLNRQSHPKPGEPSDKNQVGEVVRTRVDPETGALIATTQLHNSLDGWRTFHDVEEGRLRQFSTGKVFETDLQTLDVSNHEAMELSAVHQGDNEKGVGFATSIFPPRLSGTFTRVRDSLLQDLQNGEWNWHTSEGHPQPHNKQTTMATPAPMEQTPTPAPTEEPTTEKKETEVPESRLEELAAHLRSEIAQKVDSASRETAQQVQSKEQQLAAMEKELKELREMHRKQQEVEMKKLLKPVASLITGVAMNPSSEAIGGQDELKSYQEDLFKTDRTGVWHPSQRRTAHIMAQAEDMIQQSMSKVNEARELAKSVIRERDQFKQQLDQLQKHKDVSQRLETPTPAPNPKKRKVAVPAPTIPLAYAETSNAGWGSWCTK